ncbi:Asp23/Gls24 family envelope stress response protein [uncultured Tyzzerella sp.]|uniref:Asp23/Gls24 family envelope stress response protein n=1 Tax=uncultured Tyzzerella sp. TaxID=2321398 RepID=UPI0029422570|nr:Asp23/Gls24 family envelope stress response protein [uncultured Tyzzerella sp.]
MSFTNNNGIVQISDDVLVAIVQTATMEIDGVHSINSTLASEIIGKFGKKTTSKGINIFSDENKLTININLSIKQNYKILDVAQNIQNKVKTAIENMTGLEIDKININVASIETDKNKNTDKKED